MFEICRLKDHKETKLKFPYESNHMYMNNQEYKLCSICNKWLLMNKEFFYKNKSSPDGLNPYCKQCTSDKNMEWERQHKERALERARNYRKTPNGRRIDIKAQNKRRSEGKPKIYYQNNKDKFHNYSLKSKNKKHDITKEEWEYCKDYFNYSCAYCGITETEAKKQYGQYLHKEHAINEGASDLSNCIPACKSCNVQKNIYDYDYWYVNMSKNYDENRFKKIKNWLEKDWIIRSNLV